MFVHDLFPFTGNQVVVRIFLTLEVPLPYIKSTFGVVLNLLLKSPESILASLVFILQKAVYYPIIFHYIHAILILM